jgi:pantoate--beta-alanine ligase
METLVTKNQIKEVVAVFKSQGKAIAFVPTMGFLHEGHLSLVRKAKVLADIVIVSIFVNKAQFNEESDFLEYPRDHENDARKLINEGVDYLFLPSDDEIYPKGESDFNIAVDQGIANILCAKYRKGHFSGVCNVLMRFFDLIEPDYAVFGLKDFQQYFIVKKMAEFLNLKVEVIGVKTVREENGIAMSSRNSRLSAEQRIISGKIYDEILQAKNDIKSTGNINFFLQNRAIELESLFGVKFDYLELRKEGDLQLVNEASLLGDFRLFWAYKIGEVRLIDNIKL